MYSITLQFNEGEFSTKAKDIEEGILSLKPTFLHTEMYVTVKKGKKMAERKLNLIQGRRLFNDPDFREVFMNNLLLV